MNETQIKLDAINQAIGSRLKSERERLGLTAISVYKGLNISQSTLTNYEKGMRDIRSDTLAILADKFGYDVLFVITGHRHSQSASNPFLESDYKRLFPPLRTIIDELSSDIYQCAVEAEDTLLKVGAIPNVDYNYRDILSCASRLVSRSG